MGDPRRWTIRKMQKWDSGAQEFGMRGKQVEYDFLGVAEVASQGRKSYCIRGCVIRGRGIVNKDGNHSRTAAHIG